MITESAESPQSEQETPKVVLPRPLRWHQRLVASLIYLVIRGVAASMRYRWEFHPKVLDGKSSPFIFVIWHNRLPLSLLIYEDYVRRRRQPPRLAGMVSASKDGGVASRILEHFGVQPVRGSSSRRGPQALLEMTTWAERGYDIAITPDGPRGPRYVVQPGTISLAQLTGLPIVPASYHLSWKIRLRSWDQFQIPVPFGRVVMRLGEPVLVPRDATDEERERCRQEVESRMNALTCD